jgi:hypothetical protein
MLNERVMMKLIVRLIFIRGTLTFAQMAVFIMARYL